MQVARETSVDEINDAFRSRADTGGLTGILQYTEDPIVSSDIVKSPLLVDLRLRADRR